MAHEPMQVFWTVNLIGIASPRNLGNMCGRHPGSHMDGRVSEVVVAEVRRKGARLAAGPTCPFRRPEATLDLSSSLQQRQNTLSHQFETACRSFCSKTCPSCSKEGYFQAPRGMNHHPTAAETLSDSFWSPRGLQVCCDTLLVFQTW